MGILVLGVGIGGLAIYGALLHVINNGLTKGVLFLSAGNIRRAYDSKFTDDVSGALQRVPLSGWLFLMGFLAIAGSPPFGPFVSEFTIARAALSSGQYLTGGLYLLLLGIVFIGMGATVLAVVQGPAPEASAGNNYRDHFATGAPVVLFLALVLLLGLYLPPPLEALLREGAAFVEGKP
jgi:hydrogenase-4 component F